MQQARAHKGRGNTAKTGLRNASSRPDESTTGINKRSPSRLAAFVVLLISRPASLSTYCGGRYNEATHLVAGKPR
jgi:hypothetical protein